MYSSTGDWLLKWSRSEASTTHLNLLGLRRRKCRCCFFVSSASREETKCRFNYSWCAQTRIACRLMEGKDGDFKLVFTRKRVRQWWVTICNGNQNWMLLREGAKARARKWADVFRWSFFSFKYGLVRETSCSSLWRDQVKKKIVSDPPAASSSSAIKRPLFGRWSSTVFFSVRWNGFI